MLTVTRRRIARMVRSDLVWERNELSMGVEKKFLSALSSSLRKLVSLEMNGSLGL